MSDQAGGVYRPFPSFVEWEIGGLDTSDFERYSAMLAATKESVEPATLQAAMTTAQRYAAVDTNAIEGLYEVDRGFTRTIATQAAAWESVMDARGPHVRPAFDDALNAYGYVLDAATRSVELTEKWIKDLHAIICASQELYRVYTEQGPQDRPLPKGTYKTMPNSPTLLDGREHAYAPVIDTPPEMNRLVNELRSEAFLSAHPILQAAYAHYAYVCIHPFADGNGRVARALSSVFLYRSPGVPLIVFADQRNEYYDALESADNGDPFPFLRFMMTRTVDAIGIIKSTLQRNSPPIDSTVQSLTALFNSGSDAEERHAAADRLCGLAVNEATAQIRALSLPTHLKVTASRGGIRHVGVPHPPGYEKTGNNGFLLLRCECSWPHQVSAAVQIESLMRADDSATSDLLLVGVLASLHTFRNPARESDGGVEVWLRELVPVQAEALKLKMSSYIEGKIGELLGDVAKQVESSGRQPR
jgi:Fic family protein